MNELWEYRTVSAKSTLDLYIGLSASGHEGWELVSVVRDEQSDFCGVMKRRLPPGSPKPDFSDFFKRRAIRVRSGNSPDIPPAQ